MAAARNHPGRIPPQICAQLARLVLERPPLTTAQIATRTGVHPCTVRRFRRGRHKSQRKDCTAENAKAEN